MVNQNAPSPASGGYLRAALIMEVTPVTATSSNTAIANRVPVFGESKMWRKTAILASDSRPVEWPFRKPSWAVTRSRKAVVSMVLRLIILLLFLVAGDACQLVGVSQNRSSDCAAESWRCVMV